ncbi:MAG: hypothetical protein HIU81_03885 [Acidobacteria bacterium]|nr:hypothetical protein [Acidobacteriota bacterium]
MEQAATGTIAGIWAQLGIGGLILSILITGAAWYLKVSKELREEKRGVIRSKDEEIDRLRDELNRTREELLDCRFPKRHRTEAQQEDRMEGHS